MWAFSPFIKEVQGQDDGDPVLKGRITNLAITTFDGESFSLLVAKEGRLLKVELQCKTTQKGVKEGAKISLSSLIAFELTPQLKEFGHFL